MDGFVENTLQPHFNFWIYVILMMIGLWALIAKNNLIKKLIGLSIFQTAIILFYVSIGVKEGATIPILEHKESAQYESELAAYEEARKAKEEKAAKVESEASASAVAESPEAESVPKKPSKFAKPDPDLMANPLPHVLMLTAIVVGVATLGVALSIVQAVFRDFGSLEEDEILQIVKSGNTDD